MRLGLLLSAVIFAGCAAEPERLPEGTACPYAMSVSEGCRAEPTPDELAVPWPEHDAAMRNLAQAAAQVPTLDPVAAARLLSMLDPPGLPTYAFEGYGIEGANVARERRDRLAAIFAEARTALEGLDAPLDGFEADKVALAEAAAKHAWDAARSATGTNHLGQAEPRVGLYEAVYAATTLMIIERYVGTRAKFESARADAEAFASARTGALAAQEQRTSLNRGATTLREVVATWPKLEPKAER